LARQGFASADINDFPPAAFSAINTTTTETSFVGNTAAIINQFCQLANNDARAGKIYMVQAGGTLGTSSSAPTMIITPRWGNSATMSTNVTLGASATVTMTASLSAVNWYYEFVVGIRTGGVGATAATAVGHGTFGWSNASTTAPYSQQLVVGGTAATVDTTGSGTAGMGLQTTVTWGTSNASNTLTCGWYVVRSLN
jgi:hypothetical protein